MNYQEEQKNELEALSEIYFNEIKVISNKPPITFSINVRPQASTYEEPEPTDDGGDSGDDDSDLSDSDEDELDESYEADRHQQGPNVELQFTLPAKYPEEKPSIEILNSNCISEEELSTLMRNLNNKADESLGTVMVFTLVSDVVEWLITKTDAEAVEIEQEKERKQKEIEEEETKRFEGTPVTEKTFLAWKAKFDAEMLKAKLEQQKQSTEVPTGTKMLTGRAMFETDTTLAESDLNFVEDLDQNQLEALLHNIEDFELEDDDVREFEDEMSELSGDFELLDEESEDEDEDTVCKPQTSKLTSNR